jgi:hypothetical protein
MNQTNKSVPQEQEFSNVEDLFHLHCYKKYALALKPNSKYSQLHLATSQASYSLNCPSNLQLELSKVSNSEEGACRAFHSELQVNYILDFITYFAFKQATS